MHSIKVLDTARIEHLETGGHFVEITIEVFRDDESLHTRKLGFDDDATETDIVAKLDELRADYDAQVEREKQIAADAEKAKTNLIGLEVGTPEPEDAEG